MSARSFIRELFLLDRLQPGRYGGLGLWPDRIFSALILGGFVFLSVLWAVHLAGGTRVKPDVASFVAGPAFLALVALIMWIGLRACTAGVRVEPDASVRIFQVIRDRVIPASEVVGFEEDSPYPGLRLATGSVVSIVGLNAKRPKRRKAAAAELNQELRAARDHGGLQPMEPPAGSAELSARDTLAAYRWVLAAEIGTTLGMIVLGVYVALERNPLWLIPVGFVLITSFPLQTVVLKRLRRQVRATASERVIG